MISFVGAATEGPTGSIRDKSSSGGVKRGEKERESALIDPTVPVIRSFSFEGKKRKVEGILLLGGGFRSSETLTGRWKKNYYLD